MDEKAPMYQQMQNNSTWLLRLYDTVLNGIPKLSEPIAELTSPYIKQYGYSEKAINAFVLNQKLKCSATGFVTGLGGILTLPITLPADLASSLYMELRMIAGIAILRGYNIHDDQVKTLICLCLVGNTISDVLKQVGIKISNQLAAKKLLPLLTRSIITKINHTVGFRLLAKGGTKGIIRVSKAIPVVGGIIGGTFNWFEVDIYARIARKMFCENQ